MEFWLGCQLDNTWNLTCMVVGRSFVTLYTMPIISTAVWNLPTEHATIAWSEYPLFAHPLPELLHHTPRINLP